MFWLNFFYFFLAIFFAWYVPGRVILGKKSGYSPVSTLVISVLLGLVMWNWQAYLFGYLKVRAFTYIYLFIFIILFFYRHKISFPKIKNIILSLDLICVFIILLGTLSQNIMTWGSGLKYNDGIRFYQINKLDGIMHLAYIQSTALALPPLEPGLSGSIINNYHYWSNLTLGELHRVFNLPIINLFFQYSNFFLSLFLGLSAYVFVLETFKLKIVARWFCFFLLLGGDFGYLLMGFFHKKLSFQIPALDPSAYFLQNPPRAYSVLILFAGLTVFFAWLKKKDLKSGFIWSLIFGCLVGFKIYTGILLLISLGTITLFLVIKKNFAIIPFFLLTLFFSALVFLPNNLNSGGLFWAPLAWPLNFLTQEKVNLGEWELRRLTYLADHNFKRVVQMNIMIVLFFFVSQFGLKIVAVFAYKKIREMLKWPEILFFYSGIFISFFLGLFYLQKSGGYNIFNFFASGGIYLSLLASLFFGLIYSPKHKIYYFIITLFIVSLYLPRTIYVNFVALRNYLHNTDSFIISWREIDALNYLKFKTSEKAVVLVDNRNSFDRETPYVAFFSGRKMFLSGQGELRAHEINLTEREKQVNDIFNSTDFGQAKILLMSAKINYLYLYEGNNLPKSLILFPTVFKNNKIRILKVI